MSVTHLVSDRVETDPSWPVSSQGTWNGSAFVIQQNPTALPRAYVVPRATIVPEQSGVVLTSFCDLDPSAGVLMSHDPLATVRSHARQPFTEATWTSTDPDRLGLAVTTSAPGLLVVADSWMPGWTANVDGRPAPVFRGNYAQRVIPLFDPGVHTISMAYQPPGLALGCKITLAAAMSWLVMVALCLRIDARGEMSHNVKWE
jgi:hypothetical protein